MLLTAYAKSPVRSPTSWYSTWTGQKARRNRASTATRLPNGGKCQRAAPLLQASCPRGKNRDTRRFRPRSEYLRGLQCSATLHRDECVMHPFHRALRPQQEQQRAGVQLLSIPQLCQELGMGKSWVYRRLRGGEIPSIRLGRTIKVRREELEQYLERHHYPARSQPLQEEDSPPH